jgi:hypothetical protein
MKVIELLNFTFAHLLDGMHGDDRKRIIAALEGRLGPGGGIIVDDPDLPESLQGMEAPSWWVPDEDPFANQFDLSNVSN